MILFNQDLLFDVVKCIANSGPIIKMSLPKVGAMDMLGGYNESRSKNLTTIGSSFRRYVWISMKRVGASLSMVLDTVP